MSRAKDQASQQRAILYAALLNGQFATGAQQELLTSQSLESEYLLAFERSATNAELNAYLAAVAGLPVDSAQLLNNYLGTQADTAGSAVGKGTNPCTTGGLGMAACELGQSYGARAPAIVLVLLAATFLAARSDSEERSRRRRAER